MQENYKELIRGHLIEKHGDALITLDDNESQLVNAINEIIKNEGMHIRKDEADRITKELLDELLGFGPLTQLLQDNSITEIMVNGPGKVYVEKDGKICLSPVKFDSQQQLFNIIQKILDTTHRHIDELSPFTDVSLRDGSRVNIVIAPIALDGPVITIRKFLKKFSSIEDLTAVGTVNSKMAEFLVAVIKAKLNIVFSGGTGVGKTTTVNVLSNYISNEERIITIEDTAELKLNQEHVVRLEARPSNMEGKGQISIRDLFKNSLRMRPNRIILGEIRSSEALDMLQAMCSGHNGALSVIHANSPQDVVARIETMILTSGVDIPLWVIRKQIGSSIDLVVHQEQLPDGSRKITHITEVREIKDADFILQDLFSYEIQGFDNFKVTGIWKSFGVTPLFFEKFKRRGVVISEDIFK